MGSRALVVDDEPAICELIHGVLATAGFDALAVVKSSEAEQHIGSEKFAVLLFDFRMPPPDGLALARLTRRSGINQMTPIILMSDDQSTAATSQGFAAGASVFLYKPIDKKRLLALVRATHGAIEHERRRFRRVPLHAKVRIGSEKDEWECETIDVSLNGMLVNCPVSLPLSAGSSVRVSLDLAPGAQPIKGFGSVVRRLDETRMGIQLTQLAAAESGRLQDFLLPLILRDGVSSSLANARP